VREREGEAVMKGFLKDHMELMESMKFYFLIPRKEIVDGLVFLHDDNGRVKMTNYINVGGVAHVFVEYHGKEYSEDTNSGS
jgi:hypothetical protein